VRKRNSLCRSWKDAPPSGDRRSRELRFPGMDPDGHALTYLHTKARTRDLYMQPLAGGAPVQLIHFDSEPSAVTAYGWSNDGKKIAITRLRFND